MNFSHPTLKGKIIKRYKRFLADINLPNGEQITAHTANTGSMKTCWEPGWTVLLTDSGNRERKYPHSLELIHNGKSWIGVNTSIANKLVVEAIQNQVITELTGYQNILTEVTTGDSRIDIKLTNHHEKKTPDIFIEVKNVTLLGANETACFPDSESTRGQKHLSELISLKKQGFRAAIFYVIQRNDVKKFQPAFEIDPAYADLFSLAIEAGVEVLCYECNLSEQGVRVSKKIPLLWP